MATSLLQRGRLVPVIAIALLCAPIAARATVITSASSVGLDSASGTEFFTTSDEPLDADVSSLASGPQIGESIQDVLDESTAILGLCTSVASSLMPGNADMSSLASDLQIGESIQDVDDESPTIFGSCASVVSSQTSSLMPGDADGDGTCDQVDLDIVLANYNQSGKSIEEGDFNDDDSVNGTDLNIVLSNFNQSLPVPEPSALALLCSGCIVFGLNMAIHRNRRRKL